MDVERILQFSPCGGPESWEVSRRAIESYSQELNSRGFPVTFFIVPEAMEYHASLFRQLKENGNECGLHFHPTSFRDGYQSDKNLAKGLGCFPRSQQELFLKNAVDQYHAAAGFSPTSFRGGFFSASPETYEILSHLNIKVGSTTIPGRFNPEYHALWRNVDRGIHSISACPEFCEVPFSTYVNFWGWITKNGDSRLEKDLSAPNIQKIQHQHLKWQETHHSRMLHFCFFTHNKFFFDEASIHLKSSRRSSLLRTLDQIQLIAKEANLNIKGCTLSQIRQQFSA